MSCQRLQWKTVEVDEGLASGLARELGLPRPLGILLAARGLTDPVAARAFLSPRLSRLSDPLAIPGMDRAADRLLRALRDGERIAVYGDYDADGVTATALAVSVLGRLGAHVQAFLPDRVNDGYGLTPAPMKRCIETLAPRLVLTVDCGVSGQEAIRLGNELGVDTIVTDHHEPPAILPPAAALVDPKLGAPDGMEHLAGVGVAFKLCHAVLKRLIAGGASSADLPDLREYLDLVALGTVCDIVPLVGENRVLVRHGLQRLARAPRPGLRALCRVAGVDGAPSCYHLAYLLGPRLNAAGRTGSADPALALLLTQDPEEADVLADQLDAANRERQRREAAILELAVAQLAAGLDVTRDFGLVAAGEGWDVGVIGIVAARLMRRHNLPVAVIGIDARGIGRGSCRGTEHADVMAALRQCEGLLDGYGGHTLAAGFTLNAARLPEFRSAFNAACAAALLGRDRRPFQTVDAWLSHLGEADMELVRATADLQPTGAGNPAAVWGVRGVAAVGEPRRIGRDGAHLKMMVASGGTQIEAVGFGMGERVVPSEPLDMLFELDENTFRGRTTLQMKIRDFRPST